jgi:phosphoribosylaminoimidazole-succinocarboxamide synthase
MSRRRQIYEGKAKILYEGPRSPARSSNISRMMRPPSMPRRRAPSRARRAQQPHFEHIFTLLGQIGIPHHFMRRLNMREQLIRQVEIIPIEVVVATSRGITVEEARIEEGTQLPRTIIEYYYKDDALGDPMIADEHIACFGWATQEE